MTSVPADYRRLAALVMAEAVVRAGTEVCEPVHCYDLRTPVDCAGACIHLLQSNGADVQASTVADDIANLEGVVPAGTIDAIAKSLPGLSRGRGDFDTRFHGYRPISGVPPTRRRSGLNPYNRREYLSRLKGRF